MRKPCCCDRGACCYLDETCEVTTQEKCEEDCGIFHLDLPCLECEDDSNCMGGSCIDGECDNGVDCTYERGPCCFCESDFSDCVEDLTEPECSLGESSRTCVDGELVIEYEWEAGDWQGPDHTCEDSCDCEDDHKGACCCDGECTDDVSEQACLFDTDDDCQYLGDDSNCGTGGGAGAGGRGYSDGPNNCGWGGWCRGSGACDEASHSAHCEQYPDCSFCDNVLQFHDFCCIEDGQDHPDNPCFEYEGGPDLCGGSRYCRHTIGSGSVPGGLEAFCGDVGGHMMYDRCVDMWGMPLMGCSECGDWDPETRTCNCGDVGCWSADEPAGGYGGVDCTCMSCCSLIGACCSSAGQCQVKPQPLCREDADEFFYEGLWCDEVPDDSPCNKQHDPCPQQTGACCVDGDNCIQDLTEEECTGEGGVYAGDETTECLGNCRRGVCCHTGDTPAERCVTDVEDCLLGENLTYEECDALGGRLGYWYGNYWVWNTTYCFDCRTDQTYACCFESPPGYWHCLQRGGVHTDEEGQAFCDQTCENEEGWENCTYHGLCSFCSDVYSHCGES